MHDSMVLYHPSINSREYCTYDIGNVRLTKETERIPPQLISGKYYCFVLDLE